MRFALLDALGADERAALVSRLRPRSYRRGQTVFNDGDPGDCLHLVEAGRLSAEVTTPAGQAIMLRVIHPGEFVGELALVQPDNRRSARLRALEQTETLALFRHDLDELRLGQPGVDRFLVVALAESVRRTTDLAVELLLPPDARVWRRLSVLAEAYGDEPIRMTQDDLASAAGTVRQTANRVLQSGVRDGVLSVGRGVVHIVDCRAVRERAGR